MASELSQTTPDRSTISRTRRLIDVETHRKVFLWVLFMLAEEGLLKGNTVAIFFRKAEPCIRTKIRYSITSQDAEDLIVR